MTGNWPKRGQKVRSISNSSQKFYVIKPKIDDFIPQTPTPPLPKKKTPPFFLGGGGGRP